MLQNINFDCPVCKQNLDAPQKMAGMMVLCPACKALVEIPPPPNVLRVADEGEKKKATVPINVAAGGLPPKPAKRRVIIKRPTDK